MSIRQISRIGFVAASAVLTAIVMSGCTGAPEPAPAPGEEPVASYVPAGEGGDSALLTGTLHVADNCLTVTDELHQTWVPVFPRNETTWTAGTLNYANSSYTPGETIELRGGATEVDPDPDLFIPDSCRSIPRWVVAQTDNP